MTKKYPRASVEAQEQLRRILRTPIAGNARDDMPLLDRISNFTRHYDVSPQLKFVADYFASMAVMGEHAEYPGNRYYDNLSED